MSYRWVASAPCLYVEALWTGTSAQYVFAVITRENSSHSAHVSHTVRGRRWSAAPQPTTDEVGDAAGDGAQFSPRPPLRSAPLAAASGLSAAFLHRFVYPARLPRCDAASPARRRTQRRPVHAAKRGRTENAGQSKRKGCRTVFLTELSVRMSVSKSDRIL